MDIPFYEQPGFHPGGFPSRVDNRNYQWSEVGAASAPFDWNAGYDVVARIQVALGNPSFTIPIKNQNDSGSCGGQAWSYEAANLEAIATGSFEERSAKFIYAQTYVPGGGSTGLDNSNIYHNQGDAREAALPSYDGGQPPSEAFMERSGDITDVVRQDAKADRALSYVEINNMTPDAVAQALRDNNGVIILIQGSNNGTWGGVYPVAPATAEWGHWICLMKAKLINGKKFFGFPNSWGTAVGDNGWQWISEDYFASGHILEGWTMVFNPNPPPAGFSHNFATNINYGDNGAEVVALQTALQLQGFFPASVPTTGYYGEITRRAVLAFQVKYAVAPMSELTSLNGKLVGVATRGKLNSLFNK